jgi:glucosamine kinase
MILIADSGSTKADWVLADKGILKAEFNTIGFNPFFHNEKIVLDALNADQRLLEFKDHISEVKFFGAGCSSPQRNAIIQHALMKFFIHSSVSVEHDMKAAALATCGDDAGIACIIGTGSNVCYFDGKDVHEKAHGLGYVLGDEGSGSYFGKKLLAYYLYEILPEDLYKRFKEEYDLTKEMIVENVYHKPNANVYLASFAKFLSDHRDHEYIKKLVTNGMNEFFQTNVCAMDFYKKVPVHFVGSIAFYFEDILKDVAKSYDVTLGKIIKKPIYDLMKYFVTSDIKN